jgi:hypothetical protein
MRNKLFILLCLFTVALCGCDGRVHIPENEYVYRSSVNEPGYEKIGVKIEHYNKLRQVHAEELENQADTIAYLRDRVEHYRMDSLKVQDCCEMGALYKEQNESLRKALAVAKKQLGEDWKE